MSTIVIINGTSSSGKSTIAKVVADMMLGEPFLCCGIDFCIDMLPEKYRHQGFIANEGFYYEQLYQKNHPIVVSHYGPLGKMVLALIPKVIRLMAQENLNIIVDEVLLDDDRFLEYVNLLHDYRVYSVGIICDLLVLEKRELLRGNRPPGLARWQVPLIHTGIRTYDLMIDTTSTSVKECAELIVTYMHNNDLPHAFISIYNKYFISK